MRKISTEIGLLGAVLGLASLSACGGGSALCDGITNCKEVKKGASETAVKTAFAEAIDGTTIVFGEGTFKLGAQLDVTRPGVTVRGAGREKTILDFDGSAAGQDGIHVATTGAFTIEDITVQDAAANAIKVIGANGVIIRRSGGVWTRPENTNNGRYALYPVESQNVLVEESYAKGSSDAGIYVGQCKNAVVRNNLAEGNVAGLEIENTESADVYGNVVKGNTAGLMIFGLPGLNVRKNASKIRVWDNEATANNTGNFALGGIVSQLPGGFGALIMAASDVEFYDNRLTNHESLSIAVVSYCVADQPYCETTPFADPVFDPFPRRIHIHHNQIAMTGANPGNHVFPVAGASELAAVIVGTFGATGPVPDIVYDGLFAPPLGTDANNPMQICLEMNGSATFSNLDANTFDAATTSFPNAKSAANTNIATFTCTLPALTAVTLAGITL